MIVNEQLISLGFNATNINYIWVFGEIGRYGSVSDAYCYNQIEGTFIINSNDYDGCEIKIDDLTHLKELLTALRIL